MAAFDELGVIVDPDSLTYGVNTTGSDYTGNFEIIINTADKKIALKEYGNLDKDGATIKAVYSRLKYAWRANTTLIKFPFPMGPITDEQFEMINGWNWDTTVTTSAGQTTPELLRTGGWSVVVDGLTNELWMSVVTLGSLGSTDQVYYQQFNSDETSVNFKLTGKVNQAIRIYYYDGDGQRPSTENASDLKDVDGTSYVLRRYFKVFVREWDKLYAQSAIGDIGVSQTTYQAYRFPLTNSDDLKITHTEPQVAGVATVSGTSSGTTATVTVATGHGFATGNSVTFAGITPAAYNGTYTLTNVAGDVLTYTTSSAPGGNITVQGTAQKSVYANVNITYLRDAADKIYNVRGTWTVSTVYAVGDVVQAVGGSASNNLRWFACTVGGTSAGNDDNLAGGSDTGCTWVAYVGERSIGTGYYAFTTIIDADTSVGPTASGAARTTEIYEVVQNKLRSSGDIDTDATASVTGKTADSLLRFVGDTLVTSTGVYIDSFNSSDTNAIEFYDYSGTSRTFPYTASLDINFGPNLQDDRFAKYWVFFTSGASIGSFGTTTAVIVKDASGTDMAGLVNPGWTVEGNPVKRTKATHTYNYDSNDQRGGGTYNSGDGVGDTAKTDVPITVVAIGLRKGQYVSATGTIQRSTGNSVTLTASLERNYAAEALDPTFE